MKRFILGLTGSMGSGKTTVASLLSEKYGFFTVDADVTAHEVTDTDPEVRRRLVEEFGEEIIRDGVLDRKLLAKYAFESQERTERLNSITHPAILSAMSEKIAAASEAGHRLILLDVPLLFECGWDSMCHKVVSVIAPYEQKVRRVMLRDNISREEVEQRLSRQKSDRFYIENSDYIIVNDGGSPEKKVAEFMQRLASEVL